MSAQAEPACPRCNGPTKLRKGGFGEFWSCTRYPHCKGTVNVTGRVAADITTLVPAKPPQLGANATDRPVSIAPPDFSLLDEHQHRVATFTQGLGVVAAAAGSGKTHTVIQRTLYLLSLGEVPESICLLAYNKDAAETLRNRLAAHVPMAAPRVNIFTFHAWCYAVLRYWYPGDARYHYTRILGGAGGRHPIEIAQVVASRMRQKGEDEPNAWSLLANADRVAENMVRLDVQETEEHVARAMGWLPDGMKLTPDLQESATRLARFCRDWRAEKAKEAVIDFTDMLCAVAGWIRNAETAPHVAWLTTLYRHVMVDEAQDINPARLIVASHLGRRAASLLYVGDLRQSLYSFVGAQPDLFLALARAEGATLLTLPVNRRSTGYIVDAANAVAEGHHWNLGGATQHLPDRGLGEPLQVVTQETPGEEAAFIAEDVSTRIRRGLPLDQDGGNYRVIARTNAMLVDLEYAFVARGLPVRVLGSAGGVWGTTLGQHFLAYLEGVEGHPVWGLVKVANQPKRFVRKDDVRDVIQAAIASEQAGQGAELHMRLRAHASAAVKRFGADLEAAARRPWGSRCLAVARWLGVDKDDSMESGDKDRADALRAILSHAQTLGSLKGIQDYRESLARAERLPAVLLSTIHAAKGQEARVVYVAGVRVGKLPHSKCESLDEERRVLYVAISRAQHACIVTTGGKPSTFLRELQWVEDDAGATIGAPA